MKRGASIAVCGSMPNTVMFRIAWMLACVWLSPPGLPMGMTSLPGWSSIAGLGVRRGRLPAATHDAWPAVAHDCEPRELGASPVPGITRVSLQTSLGAMQIALPRPSTTVTHEVSYGPSWCA